MRFNPAEFPLTPEAAELKRTPVRLLPSEIKLALHDFLGAKLGSSMSSRDLWFMEPGAVSRLFTWYAGYVRFNRVRAITLGPRGGKGPHYYDALAWELDDYMSARFPEWPVRRTRVL